MSWSIIAVVLFSVIGLYLLYLQLSTSKYCVGNVWETEDGKIAIIIDLSIKDDYILVVKVNGERTHYNIKGEQVMNYPGSKFKKHLGTRKQLPEYFL